MSRIDAGEQKPFRVCLRGGCPTERRGQQRHEDGGMRIVRLRIGMAMLGAQRRGRIIRRVARFAGLAHALHGIHLRASITGERPLRGGEHETRHQRGEPRTLPFA